VGGAARAGDDDLDAAVGGAPAVLDHLVGHPVRGDHVGLERDAELGDRFGGGLHHRPVGVAAHDDADAHVYSPVIRWTAAWRARARTSSRSSPTAVTWPILRPGRTCLP